VTADQPQRPEPRSADRAGLHAGEPDWRTLYEEENERYTRLSNRVAAERSETGLREALAKELVDVVRMESEGRVLTSLSVEQRAAQWAIGIARRLAADSRPEQREHVHEWTFSIHDAARWCDCGVSEATPVEADYGAVRPEEPPE